MIIAMKRSKRSTSEGNAERGKGAKHTAMKRFRRQMLELMTTLMKLPAIDCVCSTTFAGLTGPRQKSDKTCTNRQHLQRYHDSDSKCGTLW